VNEEWVETDATGWNKDVIDVTDERVHALRVQVGRLELTINDIHRSINGLKMAVDHEQQLRHASEQVLRDEMSRSLRVVTEQVAIQCGLAISNSARGSGSHDIQQQPVQNLAAFRQEILAMMAELEGGSQQLAHQAAKQQIDLLWPVLQQQVHASVKEVRGRAQDLARQAAEQQIELLWPALEKQGYSQKASSRVVNDNASVLQNGSAKPRLNCFDEQPDQLPGPEQSMEALRQLVDARERDSDAI